MILQLEIPDDKKQIIIDAFCFEYGYQEQVPELDASGNTVIIQVVNGEGELEDEISMIPNPESAGAFTKRMLIELIKVTCIRAKKKQHENIMNSNVVIDRDIIKNINIV